MRTKRIAAPGRKGRESKFGAGGDRVHAVSEGQEGTRKEYVSRG
jgi:hypothetical protein